MSAFTVKSEVIRNRDAQPPLLTNPESAQGVAKVAMAAERTSNAGSDLPEAGTAIKLITIPSNARIHTLEHAAGALGTSSLDIAVFYPTRLPQGGANAPANSLAGTCVASSLFATAIAGVDTLRAWTDAMGVGATPTLQNRMLPLWKLVGLSADPGLEFDLGFTVRTANAINGYVGLRATYVD